jgi:acyl-CoA-binding protein
MSMLLYLSRRARPDIINKVSFLCTLFKNPTLHNEDKLFRLLGYLEGTKKKTLVLKVNNVFGIEAYMDASFLTHSDGKSHYGIIVLVGGVTVFAAWRKQKCDSKTLAEVELVAFLDNLESRLY